jgi:hypothetical protein
MEYTIDTISALMFFLFFYTIGGGIFYLIAYQITKDNPTPYVSLAGMEDYFLWNKDFILLLLSITWMVSWFFMFGCAIGYEIHNKFIIKDEEDRIAAWFV